MGRRDSRPDLDDVVLRPRTRTLNSEDVDGVSRPRPIGEHLRGYQLSAVKAVESMLGFRREDGLEVLVSWRSLQAPSVRYGKPAFIGVADAAGFAHDPVPLVGRTVTELLKVEEALLVRTSDGLLFRIAWLDDGLSEPGVPYLEDVRRARPAA